MKFFKKSQTSQTQSAPLKLALAHNPGNRNLKHFCNVVEQLNMGGEERPYEQRGPVLQINAHKRNQH